MTAEFINKLRSQSSELLVYLAIPLRVLSLGKVVAFVYIVALAVLAGLIGITIQDHLHTFVNEMSQRYKINEAFLLRLHSFVSVIAWLVPIPIIVASTAHPARLIYTKGKVPIFTLLKETPMALRLSIQACLLSLRISLYYLAAPLAIWFTYDVFLASARSLTTVYTAWLLFIALTAWAFTKIVPLFMSPFVAVCGMCEHWFALGAARTIYSWNEVLASSLALIPLATGLVVHCIFLPLGEWREYEFGVQIFFLEYLLLMFAGFVMRNVSTLAVQQNAGKS